MDDREHQGVAQKEEGIFLGDSEEQVPEQEFFLFELDGELYAVSVKDLELVMKIPPVTVVPNSPVSVAGIFHLRGRVIVVLDLLKRMGLPRTSAVVPYYLFVTSHEKNHFGVLVDRTRTVVRVRDADILPLDTMTAARIPERYVKGMFLFQDHLSAKARLKEVDIMISPLSAVEEKLSGPAIVARPAVILDLPSILDEEDVKRMAEQEPHSADAPSQAS